MFADVAFHIGLDKVFTYEVPSDFRDAVRAGVRVQVPFGRRMLVGIVAGTSHSTSLATVKPIRDVLDAEPLLSPDLLTLCRWIAGYYMAPIGEVLRTAIPRGFSTGGKRIIITGPRIDEKLSLSPGREQVVREVRKQSGVSLASLQKRLRVKSLNATVNALARDGIVTIIDEPVHAKPRVKTETVIVLNEETRRRWEIWKDDLESSGRAKRVQKQIAIVSALLTSTGESVPVQTILKQAKASTASFKSLVEARVIIAETREVVRSSSFEPYEAALGAQNIILNLAQQNALDNITSAISQSSFKPFLLHGVTGSGKTQVYIEAIRHTLVQDKSAIVLVPEISLTPQIVRRFMHHFGDRVGVHHSKMSAGERYDVWRLTREGRYRVVIGPRSALFAPVHNLGLIVVDEEHEAAYKQFDQTPRYHARDVAIMRAQERGAVVLLGSATPSVESYFNASSGRYQLLELPERVDDARMPAIEIVDMIKERQKKLQIFRDERKAEFVRDAVAARASKRKFAVGSVSDRLQTEIEDRLRRHEGIILLQNRRGFAPFLECLECAHVEMCENCSVTLTYHLVKKHLRCHYCGAVKPPPDTCPSCHGIELKLQGFGTQRVEEELQQHFPESIIVRMDLDTTSRKGAHDRMLRQFAEGGSDILLGTQMVAKGLDFSRVSLVGVISADIQMLLPDFRSAERTFQLLTQVAGRAGRSGALQGEVVIQTSQPSHYALKHVLTHDYRSFYAEELEYRKELSYPPFSRMALLELRGTNENTVMRHAEQLAALIRSRLGAIILLGPAAAAIPRIKQMFRWHIIMKSERSKDPGGKKLHETLQAAISAYEAKPLAGRKDVRLIVDIDPVGLM